MAPLPVCVFLVCTLSLTNLCVVSCKRILIVPYINSSHTIIIHAVASRLAARGHSVTVLWANEFTQGSITRHPNYTLFEFSIGMEFEELQEATRAVHEYYINPDNVSFPFATEMGLFTRIKNYLIIGRSMSKLGAGVSTIANLLCKAVLSDDHLMAKLREQHFDITLVDDFFVARCLYLIPRSLGTVPYNVVSIYNIRVL